MIVRIQRDHVIIILLGLIFNVEDLVTIGQTLKLLLWALSSQVAEYPIPFLDVLIIGGHQILMNVFLIRVDELT